MYGAIFMTLLQLLPTTASRVPGLGIKACNLRPGSFRIRGSGGQGSLKRNHQPRSRKLASLPSVPVPRCCWLDGVRTVKCGPRKMAKNFYYLLFNKRHSLASERKSFEREREEKKKLKKDEESCTVLFFEDLDERG